MHVHHAAFAALSAALLLAACATDEAPAQAASAVVAIPAEEPATPEFHNAAIGQDSLRSRLSTDN